MQDPKDELKRRNRVGAERQRTYRGRMKSKGFCLVQEWVPCKQRHKIKAIAKYLRDGGTIVFEEEN